jgi:FkbM family methyltransferase
MKKTLKPNMTVVDVGANIGYFTLLAAKIVQRGHVYAFEPEETNFKLLSKSLSLNNLRNVDIYQKALSDREDQIKLYLSDATQPQSHSITPQKGTRSVNVASTTLDAFWKSVGTPKIDFLKIHVAGAEEAALAGATQVLRECKPLIAMMFVPNTHEQGSQIWTHLRSFYDSYQLVNSPFLIKPVKPESIFKRDAFELILAPKFA